VTAEEHFHEGEEKPPPGVAAMAVFRWLLLLGALVLACAAWWSYAHADPAADHAPKYRCPMHPQITSEDPGECPICHMALEPIPAEAAAPDALYRCPMHPQITAHEPGQKCPICGMDLEKVEEQPPAATYACPMHPDVTATEPGQKCPQCGMDLEPVREASPPGTSSLTLGLDRLQAIGVRTADATEHTFTPTLRTAAIVEFAETGASRVHARASGFIEKIHADETGVRVQRGQRLAEYYSPEIYQAQMELLAARNWTGGQPLAAARQRLELLGVPAAAVERVLKTGKPDRTVDIVAPASGVIVRRDAVIGAYVSPEQPLYELVEDRALYLVAEIPAARAAAISKDIKGQVTFTGRPELSQELAVDLVYPSANRDSRTLRARMPIKNKGRDLVAGEVATVVFTLPSVTGVAIPRDAVVDTGGQPHVFVDLGGGRLQPRLVTLGVRDDAHVQVVSGVRAGERVVAGATFLVDAESRLRAALAPVP
jgi:Cu(I)/Ag(I) efflux system membrane fusion protein